MPISASANSNPGIGRGRKILLTDIEAAKKNEWNRRRKLRIQQVRQQANEIANNLRVKVQCNSNNDKNRTTKENNGFLKHWESKKINDLQTQYQECLKNVGQAHSQAIAQPDVNKLLNVRREVDEACANIRGRLASDVLRQNLKRFNEQNDAGIRKKKLVREKEDLRANLVASLPHPQTTVPNKKVVPSTTRSQPVAKPSTSPRKKQKLAVNNEQHKVKVLQDIPTNLPTRIETVLESENVIINSDDGTHKVTCHSSGANDCGNPKTGWTSTNHSNWSKEIAHKKIYSDDANCLTNVTKKDICQCIKPIIRLNVKTVLPKDTEFIGSDPTDSSKTVESRRRRRYSDSTDFNLDDGFDSDITWPPSSIPRQRSVTNLKDCSIPTSRTTKYYDHNNRFCSVRNKLKPDVFVKKLDSQSNNFESVDEERRIVENKVSKMQLLQERQTRRGNKAVKKQQVMNDFNQLIDDLKLLDRKERQLRCTSVRPEVQDDVMGETLRKIKHKNDQKKMEMIIEKAGGGLKSTGDDNLSVIDSIYDYEQMETPKLNVAECRPEIRNTNLANKKKEINKSNEGFSNPNSNRLTLQNLMKRINEQRAQLFQELKNDPCKDDILDSLNVEGKNAINKSGEETSNKSTIPTWVQDEIEIDPDADKNVAAENIMESNPQLSHMRNYESQQYVNENENNDIKRCELKVNEDKKFNENNVSGKYADPKRMQDHSAHVHTNNVPVFSKIDSADELQEYNNIFQSDFARGVLGKDKITSDHSKEAHSQATCFPTTQNDIIHSEYQSKPKVLENEGLPQKEDVDGLNMEESVPTAEMSNRNGGTSEIQNCGNFYETVEESVPTTKMSNRNGGTSERRNCGNFYETVEESVPTTEISNRNGGTSERRNCSNFYDTGHHSSSRKDESSPNLNRDDKAYFHAVETAERILHGKNNDSSESSTTLYSLDMALSQLSIDSSPNNSFKGVKIVVKVSTHGNNIKHVRKKQSVENVCKKKNDQSENDKEEFKENDTELEEGLVEEAVPRKSNGSSSTSYLSPPDHLTPKQISMLCGLLKDIENRSDKGVPLLKYYIQKLLCMTRDSVDRLDVSSSDASMNSSLFEDNNFNATTMPARVSEPHQPESPIRNELSEEEEMRRHLEFLRLQLNKKHEQRIDNNDIVDKYTQLAKCYADRINHLADIIGNMDTSEPNRRSRNGRDNEYVDDETTYLSLPPETNVKPPVCHGASNNICKKFDKGPSNINHTSWHNKLTYDGSSEEVPDYKLSKDSAFVGVSSHISPPPPPRPATQQEQHQHAHHTSVPNALTGRKPPPTILNCKARVCTPHELSTIQEVDTPSTSRPVCSYLKRSPQNPNVSSGIKEQFIASIPLHEEKIEDIDLSLLTIHSQSDYSMADELESDTNLSPQNCPDIMKELLQRGILTSPFEWTKRRDDGAGTCNRSRNVACSCKHKDGNTSSDRVKERNCGFFGDLYSSQMADEEVRGILKESSPEDIEAAFDSIGLGWASTTLRKTRRASEFPDNSSSNGEYPNQSIRSRLGRGTSTPDRTKLNKTDRSAARLIPKSESDISTVKHTSNSDLAFRLTPPDVSLQPGSMRFTTLSDESLGSFS